MDHLLVDLRLHISYSYYAVSYSATFNGCSHNDPALTHPFFYCHSLTHENPNANDGGHPQILDARANSYSDPGNRTAWGVRCITTFARQRNGGAEDWLNQLLCMGR